MGVETVRVHVIDTELSPGDIEGVTVRYYTTGESFVTSAVTDVDGLADVSLDGDVAGTDYHARFFKDTVSFTSPQVISVYSPPAGAPTGTNDFEVEGDLNAASAPQDANLCRCSGYFRSINGEAAYPLEIRFHSLYDPMIVNGLGVYSSPYYAETDEDGYMLIDLYRDSKLMTSLGGEIIDSTSGAYQRDILVPDRGTCNIVDLIFPMVIQVSWSPSSPIALTVGNTTDVTPTLMATDYRVLEGTALYDVLYTIDDTSVATIIVQDSEKLVLRGESSGTTTLTVTRKDSTIVRVPDDITGSPATINVT